MSSEPHRILVVEDSRTQAVQLEHVLQQHHFEVRVAHNGQQALEQLDDFQPDVVVTDIVMPVMDGYELCRRLKGREDTARLPVVLLTSLSDPTEVLRAIEVGADNFLTKPWQEDFLVERIQQVLANQRLRQATGGGAIPVMFGGERVDLAATGHQVVDLLLSTYEDAVIKQRELQRLNREISRSLEINRSLQHSYSEALRNAADAIVVVDGQGGVSFANEQAETLFGWGSHVGRRALPFRVGQGMLEEVAVTAPDGNERVYEVRASATFWEGKEALLASMRDVTLQVRQRAQLHGMALSDELTGLLNRRGFLLEGGQELAEANARGLESAIFFCDLDGLKWINDNLGHEWGDAALKEAASVMRATFRKRDLLSRLGGDEYAVFSPDLSAAGAQRLRERLERNIQQHNQANDGPHTVAMSVGIIHRQSGDGRSLAQLLTEADKLMYEEKRRRKAARGQTPGSRERG
jgi:two-component system cell cycle response regulator